MESRPGRVRAFCPLCCMTFEAGANSKRVLSHLRIRHCGAVPCAKLGSDCVRRFSSVNSANRHTYCYSQAQVGRWDPSLRIEGTALCEDVGLAFSNLNLDDEIEQMLQVVDKATEGPPYVLSDLVSVAELFLKVKERLGSDCSEGALEKAQEDCERRGFASVGVLRITNLNRGDWAFLHCESGPVAGAVKFLVTQPKGV